MRNGLLVIATLFALLMHTCKKDSVGEDEHSSIVILFESDVHCSIGGYSKMAGLRDAISDTAYVAMVSVGDFLQGGTVGAISDGSYVVDIMRSMHYDAIALGNHEFDFGFERQLELLGSFNAPVLCTNLFDMQGRRIWSPYTICSYGNRKVAFIGALTAFAETSQSYAFHADGQKIIDLCSERMAQLVQQSVDEARAAGADYVVLLSHVGEDSQADGCPSSHQLVAATIDIDAVLDGHSHSVIPGKTLLNRDGKPVVIAQTGSGFVNVGKLVIPRRGQVGTELISMESIPFCNERVAHTADSVRALVDAVTAHEVFYTGFKLTTMDENGVRKVRKAETNAGDIVTDAMRIQMDSDMAFINGGGIRNEIAAGDVTYGQIIDLLPFHNNLVKIQATGAQILEMLRGCIQELPGEDGEFPQVSGIRFSVRIADHSITSAEILLPDGGYAPLDPAYTYTVTVQDYAASKGGFHNGFSGCPVLEYSPFLASEILVNFVADTHNGVVPTQYAFPQNRIVFEIE